MPGGFNRRVAGLNGPLRRGQIRADKQIDVSRLDLRNLRETGLRHEALLSKWREMELVFAAAKAVPPVGRASGRPCHNPTPNPSKPLVFMSTIKVADRFETKRQGQVKAQAIGELT